MTLGIFLCAALAADSILLRTGRTVKGTIVAQTRESVVLRSGGKTQTISKKQIQRIHYGPAPDEKSVRERPQKNAAGHTDPEQPKGTGDAGRPDAAGSPPSATDRLWRSALVPGWGQWRAGSRAKAFVFLSGTILSGVAAAGIEREGASASRRYDSAVLFGLVAPALPAESVALPGLIAYAQSIGARADARSADTGYRAAGGLMALFYLVNLADAAFFNGGRNVAAGHSSQDAPRHTGWHAFLSLYYSSNGANWTAGTGTSGNLAGVAYGP